MPAALKNFTQRAVIFGGEFIIFKVCDIFRSLFLFRTRKRLFSLFRFHDVINPPALDLDILRISGAGKHRFLHDSATIYLFYSHKFRFCTRNYLYILELPQILNDYRYSVIGYRLDHVLVLLNSKML